MEIVDRGTLIPTNFPLTIWGKKLRSVDLIINGSAPDEGFMRNVLPLKAAEAADIAEKNRTGFIRAAGNEKLKLGAPVRISIDLTGESPVYEYYFKTGLLSGKTAHFTYGRNKSISFVGISV